MPLTTIKESSEFLVRKPFGPSIGYCKLPQELIDDFNKDCNTIIKDEKEIKARDISHTLVGSVKQQLSISKEVITKWSPYFTKLMYMYVKAHPHLFLLCNFDNKKMASYLHHILCLL